MSTDTIVGITIGEVKGLYADLNEKLASDNGQQWLEALKVFLKKQNPWEIVSEGAEVVIQKVTNLLLEITKVILSVTTEKKTKDCFKEDRYYFRDGDLDSYLAKVQPTGMAGQFTAHQLEKELNFKEVASAILGVSATSGLDFLSKALIENNHTVVLPQIESLIERTDAGENTGLRTDGYANFFFVINKEGSVSVVSVDRRGGRRWYVSVCHFGYGDRWYVESRFFSRNS